MHYNMGNFEIIGIIAGLIGISGIIYTIYYGRRSLRKKLLVYDNSDSIPLAQAYSPEDDYKLSVLFQRKGSDEERIESVYTTFLKFANLGKEPIRGGDIAPANPLRVEIEGARTLDIQIADVTRKVNNVSIRNLKIGDESASADVFFDFLDYQDGALMKILTVGRKGKITLSGDIIGMPKGIMNVEEGWGKESASVSGWVAGAVLIVPLAVSAYIFYLVTGLWKYAWLILVPLICLILAIFIAFAISSVRWPRGRPSFPKGLDLPEWCRSLPLYPSWTMRAEALHEKLAEKNRNLEEQIESLKKQLNNK